MLFFPEHVAAPVCTCGASCTAEAVGAAHRRPPYPALVGDHEAVWTHAGALFWRCPNAGRDDRRHWNRSGSVKKNFLSSVKS